MSNTITVTVTIDGTNQKGGTARLLLFLHDQRLADAMAAKAASVIVTIPSGSASTTITMEPDLSTAVQAGKRHGDMVEPSFYVSLDNSYAESTLTNAGQGPVFGVQLGDAVTFKLRPKETPNNYEQL